MALHTRHGGYVAKTDNTWCWQQGRMARTVITAVKMGTITLGSGLAPSTDAKQTLATGPAIPLRGHAHGSVPTRAQKGGRVLAGVKLQVTPTSAPELKCIPVMQ